MPSKKPIVPIRVTQAQHRAIEALTEAVGQKSAAELGRQLFAEACIKHGVEWPSDPATWGGKRDKKEEA